jgi:hypothetical protein
LLLLDEISAALNLRQDSPATQAQKIGIRDFGTIDLLANIIGEHVHEWSEELIAESGILLEIEIAK